MAKLKERLEHCIEAAAKATGCTYKIKWIMQYLDMRNNGVMASEYKRYMESEQKTNMPVSNSAFGSTDFVSNNIHGICPLPDLTTSVSG